MPCNVDGESQTVPLTNSGLGKLTWSARSEGTFVIDGPTSGTVASGATSEIGFRSRIPSSTPLYGVVTGAIVVSTNDPANREIRIPVSATATGASLHVANPVDVGEAPLGAYSDLNVRVENHGDADVDVDVGTPSVAVFTTEVPTFTMVAKSSGPAAGFRFTPLFTGSVEATVSLHYRGAVCDAPPSAWTLRGRGVNGIAVSPGKLDFGLVDCGSTSKPQSFKITNPTSSPIDVAVSLGSTERFVPIGPFTIASGATRDVTVLPKQVPAQASTAADAVGDTVTVTTNVSGDAPHIVKLEQTAYGAVLSMPAVTPAGRVLVDGPTKSIAVPLTNSGNAPAQVSGATSGNTATFPLTSIAAGATLNVAATLTSDPAKIGQLDARTVAYSLAGPVCGVDAPQVSMTPFDTAIDVSTPDRYDACVLGHMGRLYCGGINFAGIPTQLPSLTWIPGFNGSRVFVPATPFMMCVQNGSTVTCRPQSPFAFMVPPGTVKVFATSTQNVRFCALSATGSFQCIGANHMYQFGNGATSGPQWTQWEPSLIGVTGATDFAGDEGVSLAVAGGQVFGAGTNYTYSLARGSNDAFVAQTPVLLPGLANVTRVTSIGGPGACALHASGSATCWDQNGLHPISGILDGAEIAGGFGWLCAIRQTGGVRCSDGALSFPNVWDAPNLVTPVQKITPFCAIEANGAVTCWDPGTPNVRHLEGFEGP